MDDVARLQDWFRRGRLLPPTPAAPPIAPPSSVDLAQALAHWAQACTPPLTHRAQALRALLGAPRQIVFVLIDGLGCNLLATLPPSAFLRRSPLAELRAVFPSTTAAAVTSLATGAWPAQHAAPGWFTYLPEHDLTATILPFVDRMQGEPLEARGITAAAVFPVPPLAHSMRAAFRPLHPASIADSVYTRHHWGDHAEAYPDLHAGVTHLNRAVADASQPTLHMLYIPSIDTAEHHHGLESVEAMVALTTVDRELARLAEALPPNVRLVVSSDHGMLTVPDSARHLIPATDPLLAHLRVPPSGEPRVPFFHTRDGHAAAFAHDFRARFGERFALLSTQQTDDLHLWGPEPLSQTARDRIGDFIALSDGPDVFLCESPRLTQPQTDAAAIDRHHTTAGDADPPAPYANVRGFHAGLTPSEMRIPLIVA
ncbi:MAG: putative pyrophosphatase or phosphodiesterase [Chloroflexi bacterium]|nr:MAG: putative pyrophosphatase or phosphodiesterase [Chloroflexota bacterium]